MSVFSFQRAVLRADSLLLNAALLVSLLSLVVESLDAAGKRPDRLFGCFLACFAVDWGRLERREDVSMMRYQKKDRCVNSSCGQLFKSLRWRDRCHNDSEVWRGGDSYRDNA